MDVTGKLHKQTVLGASDNIADLLQIAQLLKIGITKRFSVEDFKPKEWLKLENALVCVTPKKPTGRHRRNLAGTSVGYLEKAGTQIVDQFRIISGTTFVGRTHPVALQTDSTKMVFEEIKLSYGQAEFILVKKV
ncbi:MAG: hypothetical protein WBP26_02225 [Candidatus Saccharimonadales bacterium]